MPPHPHHPCNKLLLMPLLIVTAISVAAYVNYLPTDAVAASTVADVVLPFQEAEQDLHKRLMADIPIARSSGRQQYGSQSDWRGNVEYTLAVNPNTLPPHMRARFMRAIANQGPRLSLANAAYQNASDYMAMTSGREARPRPRLEEVAEMSNALQQEYEAASTSRPPKIPSRWYSGERARLHRKMAVRHLSRSFTSLGRHVVAGFRGASRMQATQRRLESVPVRSSPYLRALTRAHSTFPCWHRVKGFYYGACEAGREAGKSISHLSKSAEFSAKWGLGSFGQNRNPSRRITGTRVPGLNQQHVWLTQLRRTREAQRLETLRAKLADVHIGRLSDRERQRLAELSSPQLPLPPIDPPPRTESLDPPPRVERAIPQMVEDGHVIIDDEDDGDTISETDVAAPKRQAAIPAVHSHGLTGGGDAHNRRPEASEHGPRTQSLVQAGPTSTAEKPAQPQKVLRTAEGKASLASTSRHEVGSSSRAPPPILGTPNAEASDARRRAVKAALRRAKKHLAEQRRRGTASRTA